MDGKANGKGRQVSGEYMERIFETRPRFQFKQHVIPLGIVFGATLTCMYLMSKNVDRTMPWRTKNDK